MTTPDHAAALCFARILTGEMGYGDGRADAGSNLARAYLDQAATIERLTAKLQSTDTSYLKALAREVLLEEANEALQSRLAELEAQLQHEIEFLAQQIGENSLQRVKIAELEANQRTPCAVEVCALCGASPGRWYNCSGVKRPNCPLQPAKGEA